MYEQKLAMGFACEFKTTKYAEQERPERTKQNVAWMLKIFIFGQNQMDRIVCTVGQSFNCSAAMLKVF